MFGNNSGTAMRYNSKVKVGNWNEDVVIEKLRVADFLERKEQGNLMVTAMQKRVQHSMQPCKLSVPEGEVLHIGDSVLLYSVKVLIYFVFQRMIDLWSVVN